MKVVLICHWSLSGYHLLRALRAVGANTYLIYDNACTSLRYSTSCKPLHRCAAIDHADPVEVAHIINDLHRRLPIDYVIGSDLESLLLIARMRPAILPNVYPMSSTETLQRLHDKANFIELCQSLQIDVPNSVHVTEQFDPDEIVHQIGLPLVIKPTGMFGQRGLLFVDRPQQLCLENYPYHDVVVQEHIPGQDWGASVFANEGVIVNWTTFICPDFVSAVFRENTELLETVRKIIDYTHFTGVANFDARIDDRTGRLKMFECNPRFFLRMTAARLKGLDFLSAGVCPTTVPPALVSGYYFQWRELFKRRGIEALRDGVWERNSLVRDLCEMACDPLPILGRKLFSEH